MEQSQEETSELRRRLENANSKYEAQERETFRIKREDRATDSRQKRERGVQSVEKSQLVLDIERNCLQYYLGHISISDGFKLQIDQQIDTAELRQLWATVRDLMKDFCRTMYHRQGPTTRVSESDEACRLTTVLRSTMAQIICKKVFGRPIDCRPQEVENPYQHELWQLQASTGGMYCPRS